MEQSTDMTEAEIFELRNLMVLQGKTLTQDDIDYINMRRRENAQQKRSETYSVSNKQIQAICDDYIKNQTIA